MIKMNLSNPISINPENQYQSFRKMLQNNAVSIDFLSNLKKIEKFFKSSDWSSMRGTCNGHSIAYNYVTDLLPNNRIMFTDNGVPTFDNKNLFNDLSEDHINFIKSVETKETGQFYQHNGLLSAHTGSGVTIEYTHNNNNIDETFTSTTTQNLTNFSSNSSTSTMKGFFTGFSLDSNSVQSFYTTSGTVYDNFQGTFNGTMKQGLTTNGNYSMSSLFSGSFNGTIKNSSTGNTMFTGVLYGSFIGYLDFSIPKSTF